VNIRRLFTLTGLVAALALAGCASKVDLNEVPVESRTGNPVTASGNTASTGNTATPQATSNVARVDAGSAAIAAANAAGRTVYFDYDSFVLKDEFKPLVDLHAKALVANRGKKMAIEGHTDERGGREYNLALGQKRAETVLRALTLLGSREDQLEAVSFGKERPAVPGSDEAAWAKNRRAELKDR
jgi:peptidoglycan-associated lipoprotein